LLKSSSYEAVKKFHKTSNSFSLNLKDTEINLRKRSLESLVIGNSLQQHISQLPYETETCPTNNAHIMGPKPISETQLEGFSVQPTKPPPIESANKRIKIDENESEGGAKYQVNPTTVPLDSTFTDPNHQRVSQIIASPSKATQIEGTFFLTQKPQSIITDNQNVTCHQRLPSKGCLHCHYCCLTANAPSYLNSQFPLHLSMHLNSQNPTVFLIHQNPTFVQSHSCQPHYHAVQSAFSFCQLNREIVTSPFMSYNRYQPISYANIQSPNLQNCHQVSLLNCGDLCSNLYNKEGILKANRVP